MKLCSSGGLFELVFFEETRVFHRVFLVQTEKFIAQFVLFRNSLLKRVVITQGFKG